MKRLLIFLNLLIVLAMLATGYAYHLNPLRWPLLALGGYVFPVFLIATVIFMVLWLIIKKRYALISFIALILAYQPVTLYCPLNPSGLGTAIPIPNPSPSPATVSVASAAEISAPALTDTLTVLSYNTCYWGHYREEGQTISRRDRLRDVLLYLRSTRADVMCLQESIITADAMQLFDSIFAGQPRYYIDTVTSANPGGLPMTVITRFPIARKQRIDLPTKGNNAAAFWLTLDPAPAASPAGSSPSSPAASVSAASAAVSNISASLLLLNCHLETVGMTAKEKTTFSATMHDMVKGNTERDSLRSFSRFIVGKLSASAQKHAPQADIISDFTARHLISNPTIPVIICGDFNDIPLSYSHYRIQHPVLNGNDNVNVNANPNPAPSVPVGVPVGVPVPVPVGVPVPVPVGVPVPSATEAPALTDCYQAAGFGPGFTIYQNAMRVRIDNILCSPSFTPASAHVDRSVRLSDHFPIIVRLTR